MAQIIRLRFKAVAERRQWSSAASKPRRKTRVKLNDERFAKMTADYEQEQASLQENTERLCQTVEQAEQQSVNMDSFLKIVRKYTVPDKLFPELLHAFVEKIVVHEADKSSGHRTQQIDIYYNFIGEIPMSHAKDKKESA